MKSGCGESVGRVEDEAVDSQTAPRTEVPVLIAAIVTLLLVAAEVVTHPWFHKEF